MRSFKLTAKQSVRTKRTVKLYGAAVNDRVLLYRRFSCHNYCSVNTSNQFSTLSTSKRASSSIFYRPCFTSKSLSTFLTLLLPLNYLTEMFMFNNLPHHSFLPFFTHPFIHLSCTFILNLTFLSTSPSFLLLCLLDSFFHCACYLLFANM
jgi:hypothetical protein